MYNLEDCNKVLEIQLQEKEYFGSQVNALSHKKDNKNKKHDSLDENLFETPLDEQQVKTKGVSKSENLEKAIDDEGIDLPTIGHLPQDRSNLLIEEIDNINMGTEDIPNNVIIAKSLTNQEKRDFISFLTETKINFAWSYVDMPGLDPDLVVHNLSFHPDAKPIKEKLRKMHPHIALLVKAEL